MQRSGDERCGGVSADRFEAAESIHGVGASFGIGLFSSDGVGGGFVDGGAGVGHISGREGDGHGHGAVTVVYERAVVWGGFVAVVVAVVGVREFVEHAFEL